MSSGRKNPLEHAPAAPRLSPPPAPVGNHASAPARAALGAPRCEGKVSDVTPSLVDPPETRTEALEGRAARAEALV